MLGTAIEDRKKKIEEAAQIIECYQNYYKQMFYLTYGFIYSDTDNLIVQIQIHCKECRERCIGEIFYDIDEFIDKFSHGIYIDSKMMKYVKHYVSHYDIETEDTGDDPVNHPSHYTNGGIEVHDFISAWNMDFDTGNVIKYVTRAPYKKNKLEDLEKARWYLNKLIENAGGK